MKILKATIYRTEKARKQSIDFSLKTAIVKAGAKTKRKQATTACAAILQKHAGISTQAEKLTEKKQLRLRLKEWKKLLTRK